MRARRYGESAEAMTGAMARTAFRLPPGTKKNPDALARINAAIKRCVQKEFPCNDVKRVWKLTADASNMSAFSGYHRNIIFLRLNEEQVQQLQQVMSEHNVSAGKNVVTQGEKGNHFYVVDSGELDVYVK